MADFCFCFPRMLWLCLGQHNLCQDSTCSGTSRFSKIDYFVSVSNDNSLTMCHFGRTFVFQSFLISAGQWEETLKTIWIWWYQDFINCKNWQQQWEEYREQEGKLCGQGLSLFSFSLLATAGPMGTALLAGCVQSPLSGKEEQKRFSTEKMGKWEEEELVIALAISHYVKKTIINRYIILVVMWCQWEKKWCRVSDKNECVQPWKLFVSFSFSTQVDILHYYLRQAAHLLSLRDPQNVAWLAGALQDGSVGHETSPLHYPVAILQCSGRPFLQIQRQMPSLAVSATPMPESQVFSLHFSLLLIWFLRISHGVFLGSSEFSSQYGTYL